MNKQIPDIEAGILFSSEIRFRLNGEYTYNNKTYAGEYTIRKKTDEYILENNLHQEEILLPCTFTPVNYNAANFDLTDVVIGIDFHWERKEEQKFKGSLKIIDETKHLTAINILPIEDYLLSVISSEMSATSSPELLKAHAVISRSWLLAQKEKSQTLQPGYSSCISTPDEYIRWYDREDHDHFDVCADDHCQRYQGISRAYTQVVADAIAATAGEVLKYDNKICDTRFSKCCGGVTERFENTWEPVVHPYLDKIIDAPTPGDPGDLSREENAKAWMLNSPDVFCNTTDKSVLSEVLNDYDQETQHFFRWKTEFTTEEISALVHKRLGVDFGEITDIIPVERGVSGRLIRLRITGSKKSMIIGKELVIRKAFSKSHLYSSAFIIEKTATGFIFRGAGWGHGVGLCQIGAAVMGSRGYNYREILAHYFTGSKLVKIY